MYFRSTIYLLTSYDYGILPNNPFDFKEKNNTNFLVIDFNFRVPNVGLVQITYNMGNIVFNIPLGFTLLKQKYILLFQKTLATKVK